MKAAIVTIGDEILIGQIVDTNSGLHSQSHWIKSGLKPTKCFPLVMTISNIF